MRWVSGAMKTKKSLGAGATFALLALIASCGGSYDPITLSAVASTPTTLTVEWNHPLIYLFDGTQDVPDTYILGYSTDATAGFDSMTQVNDGTIPAPAHPTGGPASARITGLTPDTDYYFIVRAFYYST